MSDGDGRRKDVDWVTPAERERQRDRERDRERERDRGGRYVPTRAERPDITCTGQWHIKK